MCQTQFWRTQSDTSPHFKLLLVLIVSNKRKKLLLLAVSACQRRVNHSFSVLLVKFPGLKLSYQSQSGRLYCICVLGQMIWNKFQIYRNLLFKYISLKHIMYIQFKSLEQNYVIQHSFRLMHAMNNSIRYTSWAHLYWARYPKPKYNVSKPCTRVEGGGLHVRIPCPTPPRRGLRAMKSWKVQSWQQNSIIIVVLRKTVQDWRVKIFRRGYQSQIKISPNG